MVPSKAMPTGSPPFDIDRYDVATPDGEIFAALNPLTFDDTHILVPSKTMSDG